VHPGTHALIHDYLDAAGHAVDEAGALFRPIRNNRTGRLERAITADGVYKLVRHYSALLGFEIGAHALRATAATNALDHLAGHCHVNFEPAASDRAEAWRADHPACWLHVSLCQILKASDRLWR
jgi:hypothetical protein